MPIEKLQNFVYNNYPKLYRAVIGCQRSGWKNFLCRHGDTLVTFGFNMNRRVRWVGHTNWMTADLHTETERSIKKNHIRNMLCIFLRQWQGEITTLDDFMAHYPFLPGNSLGRDRGPILPLPPRGDLVRFIRQNRHMFLFDDETYQLHRGVHSSIIVRASQPGLCAEIVAIG